jgi:mono/diheme cytochrome c family protein
MRRILVRTLTGLVVLVLAVVGFVFLRSEMALRSTLKIDEPALSIPADAQALARGEHIAITRGCKGCHAADLAGEVVLDVPAIGRLAAPNITRGRGSVVAAFTANDWERAIRHGIKPDGRPLLFMPIRDFAGLSDADTADLIAYVQSAAPADRDLAPSYIGPVGRLLFAFGQLPMVESRLIDQHAPHAAHIETAATPEFGSYLAQACIGCHGNHLSGGPIPGTPPDFPKPANITPDTATGIGKWSREDFYRVFREGKRPDGRDLDPFMPWKALGHFSDTELDALWAYLRSVPARPYGQR